MVKNLLQEVEKTLTIEHRRPALLNFIIINALIMILNVQKWLGSSLPVNWEHIPPGFPQKEPHLTGLKNGWTCALKPRGSSLHSIFKMADDE